MLVSLLKNDSCMLVAPLKNEGYKVYWGEIVWFLLTRFFFFIFFIFFFCFLFLFKTSWGISHPIRPRSLWPLTRMDVHFGQPRTKVHANRPMHMHRVELWEIISFYFLFFLFLWEQTITWTSNPVGLGSKCQPGADPSVLHLGWSPQVCSRNPQRI